MSDEADRASLFSLDSRLIIECEGTIRSPASLQAMISAGMVKTRRQGNSARRDGKNQTETGAASVLWAGLTRLSDDSLLITKSEEGCHVLLASQKLAKDAGEGKRVPCCAIGGGEDQLSSDGKDILAFGRLESWESLKKQAEAMPSNSVRFVLCSDAVRGFVIDSRAQDLVLCCPPLTSGQYSFHGEARGFDDCAYKSNMELTLEDGGTVVGVERGQVFRGREVSGKISNGCWGVDGGMELDYVFEDGTIFTYKGVIDPESQKFEGRWFAKDFGWEGSDENNRGWFAFEVYRNGLPQREAAEFDGSIAGSLRTFLEVMFMDRRAKINLLGTDVEARRITDLMQNSRQHESTLGEAADSRKFRLTIGRAAQPGWSGLFIYLKKRLVIPWAVVRAQRHGRAARLMGVVDADSLDLSNDTDTFYMSSPFWESLEKTYEEKIAEYLKTEATMSGEASMADSRPTLRAAALGGTENRDQAVDEPDPAGLASAGDRVHVSISDESASSCLQRRNTDLDAETQEYSQSPTSVPEAGNSIPGGNNIPGAAPSSHQTILNDSDKRCRVNNGAGWRCSGTVVPGHTLCMHHFRKKAGRSRKPLGTTLAASRVPRKLSGGGVTEADLWKVGDRVLVVDVPGGHCPLAALAIKESGLTRCVFLCVCVMMLWSPLCATSRCLEFADSVACQACVSHAFCLIYLLIYLYFRAIYSFLKFSAPAFCRTHMAHLYPTRNKLCTPSSTHEAKTKNNTT
jgi:hypothetical protein